MKATHAVNCFARQLLTACALLASVCTHAAPVDDLTKVLNNMRSAEGNFEQSLQDAKGNALQASEGQFAVKKPGKFKWLTQTPFPQTLVSNGQQLWLYDPDLEQASVSKISEKMAQTPAVLLSGDSAKIASQYDVSKLESNNQQSAFQLISRSNTADFKRIEAHFKGETLVAMVLFDKAGNVTKFSFSQVALNTELPDSHFEFAPPAGTDIIQND
ncbi:outer membrane lipoprotein chaperone LolA [Simiduia sp. 21SJ11W-1]|uniref:outer membrane lipoprotein chaperone LolA n=1 Tax=Simiduia sp. 21SJ11W-1 TaxID=2909669 RepID=UPI0020A212EA|nr:outer membrane lipoprotein chaperone LolA [Simiduia sp. 21SJ11W-1]UTA49578.1 outer membrane lipoprotein chaperone LolA [Simiduia sp. 21SJ11W-1]